MTSGNIGNGTAVGLVEYLDTIVDKGRATNGAITPLKTAFVKVIEAVDGKDWEQVKVNDIDLDDYIARFANLTLGTYSTASISVYKSRIKRVLEWYQKFMSPSQAGWMPSVAPRGTTTPRASKETRNKDVKHDSTDVVGTDTATMNRLELVIRPGSKAILVVPADITIKEVKKLYALLNAVAVNDAEDEPDEERLS